MKMSKEYYVSVEYTWALVNPLQAKSLNLVEAILVVAGWLLVS